MELRRQLAIDAAPADVWRCLTEYELRKRWMGQLVSEEIDDPERRGAGSSATVRLRQNDKIVTYRSTVIDWEPERKLSVGITGGTMPPEAAMGVIYELVPGDGLSKTVLDYQFHMPVKSFFLRLITPLIRKGVAQAVDPDLARLKALAESLAAESGGE